jgi:GxxExxY protein
MTEVIYKDEAFAIMGACFEVHNVYGSGFLEPVYQECLAIEFELRKIPFKAKPKLTLTYKGRVLEKVYEPDFICFDKIVVEIKAASVLADEHRAQLHNYL